MQRELTSYRVRRWTAFVWRDEGGGAEQRDRERKDREQHLERMAGILSRKLLDVRPKMDPDVLVAQQDGKPQLLFEITVSALSREVAERTACYCFDRALSAKVPTGRRVRVPGMAGGRPERVALRPPWGKMEVEEF